MTVPFVVLKTTQTVYVFVFCKWDRFLSGKLSNCQQQYLQTSLDTNKETLNINKLFATRYQASINQSDIYF